MKGLLIGFNIQESIFPLGLSYIKQYIAKTHPNVNLELKEFSYGNRFSYDINKNIELQAIAFILTKQPDFVAFSTYIWSIEIIQNIARSIKQASKNNPRYKNKDIKIIIGGVEANENSLTNDIDFITTGEGEITLSKLIEYLKNIKNQDIKLKDVPNLIYKESKTNKIIKTKEKYIENLDSIPFPYKINETTDSNNEESKKHFAAIRIETSRGCPYTCKYCYYATRRVRNFSIEYLEKNIPYLFKHYSFRNLTILDANFNIDTERMKAVLDIIEAQAKKNSTASNNILKNLNINFEIKPELFNKEQLDILESYPFQINLEMGLQSTNEKVLEICKRPYNITKVKKCLTLLHNSKLKYNIDLMYGLPNDTFFSFLNSVKFILNNASRQNQIRAHHFMLLNNTEFYKDAKNCKEATNNLKNSINSNSNKINNNNNNNNLKNNSIKDFNILINRFDNTNSSMVTNTNSQNPVELWKTKVFIDVTNKELEVLYSK
jgi:radical SAM superfamily enzyme YgiQ (UPF0313 family)